MSELIILYLIIYLLVVVVALTGAKRQVDKENRIYSATENLKLDQISVVIPFRNEQDNLAGLVESINKSNNLPLEFIFVNDHSEDLSLSVINTLKAEVNYSVVQLNAEQLGKKVAIREGISNAEGSYILSLDADVIFSEMYFSSLKQLEERDLYILPVQLFSGKGNILFEQDVYMLSALNLCVSGIFRPIVASGANLLYRKSAFERHDDIGSHAHIQSGDDMFLMKNFIDKGASVELITNISFTVKTKTPDSWIDFFHQRVRWAAKTTALKDLLGHGVNALQGILTLLFVYLTLRFVAENDLYPAIFLWLLKSASDMIIALPFTWRQKRWSNWFFMPIYELIYPFYLLLMVILVMIMRPSWKGRTVTSR